MEDLFYGNKRKKMIRNPISLSPIRNELTRNSLDYFIKKPKANVT